MSEGVSQESSLSIIDDLLRERVARQATAHAQVNKLKLELAAAERKAAKEDALVLKIAPLHRAVVESHRAMVEAQRAMVEAQRTLKDVLATDDDDDEAVVAEASSLVTELEPAIVTAGDELEGVTSEARPEPEPAVEPVEPLAAAPVAPVPSARVTSAPAKVGARPGKPMAPVSARAPSKPQSKVTVPERVAAAMGEGVWDAGSLEKVLASAGQEFKSGNLRTYISSILSGTKIRVTGPDGEELKKDDGTYVEVHKFTSVERGKYRVATADEMQRETRKILGSDEVIISKTPRTPADDMFEEQGINILPAIAAAQH